MKKTLLFLLTIIFLLCPVLSLAETEGVVIHTDDFSSAKKGKLPEGWTFNAYYDDGSYAETVKEPEHGVCMHIKAAFTNDVWVSYKLPVEPDSYYRISTNARCTDVNNGNGVNISVKNSFAYSIPMLSLTQDWTSLVLTGRTNDEQTEIELLLRVGGYSAESYGDAWFDGLTVEKLSSVPDYAYDFFIEHDHDHEHEHGEESEQIIGSSAQIYITLAVTVLSAAAFVFIYLLLIRKKTDKEKLNIKHLMLIILIVAFVIRIICNFTCLSLEGTYGHSTDIKCFSAWGQHMADPAYGPAKFFDNDYFCDYPPGYLWVLGLFAGIARILNIPYGSGMFAFLIKLPAMLCDIFAAWLLYKTARKFNYSENKSALISCLVALNPIFIFLSAVWGQIDIVLTLFLCLAFIYLVNGILHDSNNFINRDLILAGIFYGIATAFKPQALMAGPIFALGYICFGIDSIKNKKLGKVFVNACIAAVCAIAIIIIPSLPFKGQQGLWVVDKYLGTATSYPYATINAANGFALFGGNWVKIDTPFIGSLSYKDIGMFFMIFIGIASVLLYVFTDRKKPGAILLTCAFMIAGFFTLGHYMHERYLFPVLLMILFAALYYNDKRLYISAFAFTCAMILNSFMAFYVVDMTETTQMYTLLRYASVVTIAAFIYFAYVCYDLLIVDKGNVKFANKAFDNVPSNNKKKKKGV